MGLERSKNKKWRAAPTFDVQGVSNYQEVNSHLRTSINVLAAKLKPSNFRNIPAFPSYSGL